MRVAKLLQRQKGRCGACGLFFTDGDRMEVDHVIPQSQRGSRAFTNLQLLHHHCHLSKTARERRRPGTYDKRHGAEEPCESKDSRTVLEPSRGGDIPA